MSGKHSLSIRQEIHRFESVHPSIYAIYDLLDLIQDPLLSQQIREHVVCIEGKSESPMMKMWIALMINDLNSGLTRYHKLRTNK